MGMRRALAWYLEWGWLHVFVQALAAGEGCRRRRSVSIRDRECNFEFAGVCPIVPRACRCEVQRASTLWIAVSAFWAAHSSEMMLLAKLRIDRNAWHQREHVSVVPAL